MDYILGLGLTNVVDQRVATNYATGNLTPEQIKQIGIDAANMAIALFAAEGIDLEKDDYDLTVFTTAGYVRVNEQVMDMTMDGIYQILGSRLSRATLLPVHNARYNPLYFQFSLEKDGAVISKTLTYNPENGTFTAKNGSSCIIDQVILYDPPYDALMGWLWHNHVCGGSSPGYIITDYIYDMIPKGEDGQYTYISTNDNCKDDVLSYLLGISAGSGTYYNQRMDQAGSEVGILSIFHSETNTRRVVIIDWTSPHFTGGNSYDNYIRIYKILQKYDDWSDPKCIDELESLPNCDRIPVITLVADTWVTEEEWQNIISGGGASGDALTYIKGLPVRTQDDVIRMRGGSQTGSSTQGGSLIKSGSNGSGSGFTGFSNGSFNGSGVNVSAATVTNSTSNTPGSLPGDVGKSYEVAKTGPEGSNGTPWGTYAIVGIVSVLALGAVGFFFKGNIFGR